MIKKLIVLVACLSFVWPVNSQTITGVWILQKCESSTTSDQLICAAYIAGTINTLDSIGDKGWYSGICMPKGVTVEQAQYVYIHWAKRNPATLHHTASDLVIEAVMEAFPCGQ
jgi:hypothetical protein